MNSTGLFWYDRATGALGMQKPDGLIRVTEVQYAPAMVTVCYEREQESSTEATDGSA